MNCYCSLMKSTVEFWKTWAMFWPALAELEGKLFDLFVSFWKKVGELCKAADPELTQTLMLDVCLKNVAPLLVSAPLKRDALCDLVQ